MSGYVLTQDFVQRLSEIGIHLPKTARRAKIILEPCSPVIIEAEIFVVDVADMTVENQAARMVPTEKGLHGRRYKLVEDDGA